MEILTSLRKVQMWGKYYCPFKIQLCLLAEDRVIHSKYSERSLWWTFISTVGCFSVGHFSVQRWLHKSVVLGKHLVKNSFGIWRLSKVCLTQSTDFVGSKNLLNSLLKETKPLKRPFVCCVVQGSIYIWSQTNYPLSFVYKSVLKWTPANDPLCNSCFALTAKRNSFM